MLFEVSRRRFLGSVAAASCAHWAGAAADETGDGGKGVIDLTHSPFARLRTVPLNAVTLNEGFWSKRVKVNRDTAIPVTHDRMTDHGRFDNFLRWDGKRQALREDFHTTHPSGLRAGGDSETFKWLEAASFALASNPPAGLRKSTDEVIADVLGAQEPSGYLNTYFVEGRIPQRMLTETQFDGHELYNCGHLLMAGVANQRATGDRALLDAGLRYVNNFLLPNFGPEADKKPLLSGHPGSEMALVELYRATRDSRHLKLAGYVLQGDPRIPLERSGSVMAKGTLAFNSTYLFSGIPFTSRTRLAGHAVRCLYACCGAADYYLETGDADYKKALETLWQDLVERKMYITGGVGVPRGESFGEAYELPNLGAYSESCGSVANMMWNWRLLCATGEARFADVMERVLYNGMNAGMSLDGQLYNYANPLALGAAVPANVRKPWYNVNCCPPNLERAFASLAGYFYSTSKDGVWVHLYDNADLDWRLENGTGLKLRQRTNYPWTGDVEVEVTPERAAEFTLYLRIPAWSANTKVEVDGKPVDAAPAGQYLAITRQWPGSSRVTLRLNVEPRITAANSRLEDDTRKVAVERGPLVYCMEQIDQPAAGSLNEFSLALSAQTQNAINGKFEASLLNGVTALEAPGFQAAAAADSSEALYRPLATAPLRPASLKLIPYYTFANRAPSAMQVWIPYVRTS
jgi:hypothetical protein